MKTFISLIIICKNFKKVYYLLKECACARPFLLSLTNCRTYIAQQSILSSDFAFVDQVTISNTAFPTSLDNPNIPFCGITINC